MVRKPHLYLLCYRDRHKILVTNITKNWNHHNWNGHNCHRVSRPLHYASKDHQRIDHWHCVKMKLINCKARSYYQSMRHWSFIWNQVISYISYPLTQTFIIIIYHAIKVERQFIITNLSLFRCDCVSKEDWLLVKQNGVCTCVRWGDL